jgi:HNH endonuclease
MFDKATYSRMLSKIQYNQDNGCYEWTSSLDTSGRPNVHCNGLTQSASRVWWMVNMGDIPTGMHVLHTCDNPLCLNLAHLFLGTHRDNMLDKVAKGRQRTRKQSLNASQVLEIRARLAAGEKGIHKHYGVERSIISAIKLGKTYTTVV